MKRAACVRRPLKRPSRSRRKAGRRRLPAKELAKFRSLLLEKRRVVLHDIELLRDEAVTKTRGGLPRSFDHASDELDVSTVATAVETDAQLLEQEVGLLREIDEALARIADGTYGFCLATGKPIRKTRLKALPWAKYCAEYTRTIENSRTRLARWSNGLTYVPHA